MDRLLDGVPLRAEVGFGAVPRVAARRQSSRQARRVPARAISLCLPAAVAFPRPACYLDLMQLRTHRPRVCAPVARCLILQTRDSCRQIARSVRSASMVAVSRAVHSVSRLLFSLDAFQRSASAASQRPVTACSTRASCSRSLRWRAAARLAASGRRLLAQLRPEPPRSSTACECAWRAEAASATASRRASLPTRAASVPSCARRRAVRVLSAARQFRPWRRGWPPLSGLPSRAAWHSSWARVVKQACLRFTQRFDLATLQVQCRRRLLGGRCSVAELRPRVGASSVSLLTHPAARCRSSQGELFSSRGHRAQPCLELATDVHRVCRRVESCLRPRWLAGRRASSPQCLIIQVLAAAGYRSVVVSSCERTSSSCGVRAGQPRMFLPEGGRRAAVNADWVCSFSDDNRADRARAASGTSTRAEQASPIRTRSCRTRCSSARVARRDAAVCSVASVVDRSFARRRVTCFG